VLARWVGCFQLDTVVFIILLQGGGNLLNRWSFFLSFGKRKNTFATSEFNVPCFFSGDRLFWSIGESGFSWWPFSDKTKWGLFS